ncbi:polyketide synthase dehydratase domain-containing protein, partial [Parafrankia discariae]
MDGADVDWPAVFTGTGATRVDLPTYAFQRLPLWPRQRALAAGDAAGLGLSATGHPVLGAAVVLPGSAATVLSGWLSTATHPWLADHVVFGSVVVPGTVLLDMVLAAGERAGAPEVAELLLHAPLVLPEGGGAQIRVTVEPAGDDGQHPVTVHARADDAEPWTVQASGTLTPDADADADVPDDDLLGWPPAEAEEQDVEGLHDMLAAAGLAYGPAFRGLRRVWRRGAEVFAEVSDSAVGSTAGFAIHPASLDAVLHAVGVGDLLADVGTARLPFAFSGVRRSAPAGGALRARLSRGNGSDRVRLLLADGSGLPVARIDGLTLRPTSPGRLPTGPGTVGRSLHGVDWVERRLAGPAGVAGAAGTDGWARIGLGAALPEPADVLVVECHSAGQAAGPAAMTVDAVVVRSRTTTLLTLLQTWLADPRWADSRLVLTTVGAVAATPADPVPGLVDAALWGLARTAQSENPGRIHLVDLDPADPADRADREIADLGTSAADGREILTALLEAELPQAAFRDGAVRVPRLVRVSAAGTTAPSAGGSAGAPLVAGFGVGSVVVTGGTGSLGVVLARHLVAVHGVSDLVLLS